MNILSVVVSAGVVLFSLAAPGAQPDRHIQVHLFGGDLAPGAPLAPWYHEIGITDVWLYPLSGAFPQDQKPETQKTVRALKDEGILRAYRKQKLRFWWFERPVPDFFYATAQTAEDPKADLWDARPETDERWAEVCSRVSEIYSEAAKAGFFGIAYDNEAYYSFQGDESGKDKPWVWGGHDEEYGEQGNYYRRGLEVGRAIHKAWPKARLIMVYAFGYPGESWWYKGFQDAGIELYLGPEHTYGAGPGDLGQDWYQSWWRGMKTKQTCDWKRTQFSFIPSNQRMVAGLFPIDFGAQKPNYRARYFADQLASAAQEDPQGPIPVWIWPQGPFSPDSWKSIHYAEGEGAEDYLQPLKAFSEVSR